MTKSKDLVPTSSKDLAIIDNDDPAPIWTISVQAILLKIKPLAAEMHQLANDENVTPDDRRAGIQHLNRKLNNLTKELTDLVEKMESGAWMVGRETLPEPEQETTPHPIHQITDDFFAARWDDLTYEQKRNLLEEIIQK